MFYITIATAIISSVMWGISIYKVLENDKWRKLSYTEYKVVILFVGFLFYVVGIAITVSAYNIATDDFLNQYTTEQYLCVSTSVVIIHALIVTILPGRASRRMVEKEREVLTIKREFVKSISNEITSPLYVSHVSLEVLKAQLKSDPQGQMDKVQDQVDNIYSANETALSIMNDLLQYENIDTGTFKLTRKVVSMKHVFKGRFKPLYYLAQKYQVNLLVFDEIGASEYFKNNNSSSDIDTNTNSSNNTNTNTNTNSHTNVNNNSHTNTNTNTNSKKDRK
jgi:signal transduction histidine kinase